MPAGRPKKGQEKERRTVPTDEEILSYDCVPVQVAARYIGMTESSLRLALREERARHLGFAVEGDSHMIYNISPGGLVKYKREGGTILPLEHVQDVLVGMVVNEVRRRLPAPQ